ncbi:MAG: hypothetical protein IJX99_00220 [Clostridia bacterium]|nr:hypothetical protein [Clostridia bacterium]
MKKVLKFLGIIVMIFCVGIFIWMAAPEDVRDEIRNIVSGGTSNNVAQNETINVVSNGTPNSTTQNEIVNVDENGRKIIGGNVLHYDDDEYVVDIIIEPDKHNYIHQLTKSELDFIHDHKDSSYEIPINFDGYTKDELSEYILSTSVFVWYVEEGYKTQYSNGNIYDIDENYIYIICCNHGIGNNGIQNVENVKLRFLNNEVVVPIYMKNCDISDYALLVVDRNDVSSDLLDIIHSINTSYIYQTIEKDTKLYGYMYVIPTYKQYEATIDYCLQVSLVINNSTLEHGCSGGAMFDIYGNYYGVIRSSNHLIYKNIFPNFYNYIVEFNPEYGEPLDKMIIFN